MSYSIEDSKEEKVSNTDEVILYYWPGSSKKYFGHLALKTNRGGLNGKGIYISLWPGVCAINNKDRPYLCQKGNTHTHSFDIDELCEQTKPKNLVLYGLDIDKIAQTYQENKRTITHSVRSGLFSPGKQYQQTYVCSSFVWYVLLQGSLRNIVPTRNINKISDFTRRMIEILSPSSVLSNENFLDATRDLAISFIPFQANTREEKVDYIEKFIYQSLKPIKNNPIAYSLICLFTGIFMDNAYLDKLPIILSPISMINIVIVSYVSSTSSTIVNTNA